MLSVIKEVLSCQLCFILLGHRRSRQLCPEGQIDGISPSFSTTRKIADRQRYCQSDCFVRNAGDSESQIAANAERDIVPYYTSLEGIKSFIGVPVFFPRRDGDLLPVAVLAVDSKADDAYGPETVTLLAKFTKMLSAVLKSSTEKYDLMSESGVLKTEMRFRAKAFGESEIPNIGNALAEEVSAACSVGCSLRC